MKNIIKKFYAFNLYRRNIWVEKQSVKINKGSKILDIGAGSARYRNLFNHCDYKTQDFEFLKQPLIKQIDFVSDITKIPVEDNSFDVVLCTEVIEHVPFPIEAIKEFYRVLKKNGILLLTAPLGSGIHMEPYHFYGGFTQYWYEKFLIKEGFTITEIEPNQGFYSFYSQEHIRFLRRTAPFKSTLNLLFLPIWILLLPFGILLPLIAPLQDKYDKRRDFTIGYHVIAKKNS